MLVSVKDPGRGWKVLDSPDVMVAMEQSPGESF